MTREELEQMKQDEPNSMSPRYEYVSGWNDAIDAVAEKEPKQGEWRFHTYMPHKLYCSECEHDSQFGKLWDFCPNCGARMKEGDEK